MDIKDGAEALWASLGDVPVNDGGEIEEAFLNFEIGTDREDIWHWFEDTFDIAVAKLMGLTKGANNERNNEKGS